MGWATRTTAVQAELVAWREAHPRATLSAIERPPLQRFIAVSGIEHDPILGLVTMRVVIVQYRLNVIDLFDLFVRMMKKGEKA